VAAVGLAYESGGPVVGAGGEDVGLDGAGRENHVRVAADGVVDV